MGWLAGIDMFCDETKLAHELPGQFASDDSRDGRTEWSVEKLPWYFRNLAGFENSFIVPIFKPSHDVEVPAEFWISAIPDLSVFINVGNDLMSFPKETLALENFNYLSLVTRAKRRVGRASHFKSNDGLWTFRDTLYEAIDQTLSCIKALDKLFITFAESVAEDFTAAQTRAQLNGRLTEETEKTLKAKRERLENARLAAKCWG